MQAPVLGRRTTGEPEPDLTSLILTHRAISQDIGRLAAGLDQLASAGPAPGQVQAVRRYAAALLAQILAHHRCEEEIIWPVIAAAAGQAVDLAPLTDDHRAIGAAVSQVCTAAGPPGASHQGLRDVREALGGLRDMIGEHIADEEGQVLPVMRRYLRAQTARWCQRQVCRNAPARALRFRMPWLARYSRAGEMTRVLAAAGPRARIALVAGRPGYAWLERRAFGPWLADDDNKELAL